MHKHFNEIAKLVFEGFVGDELKDKVEQEALQYVTENCSEISQFNARMKVSKPDQAVEIMEALQYFNLMVVTKSDEQK